MINRDARWPVNVNIQSLPRSQGRRLDFDLINCAALAALHALVVRWFPNGCRDGREWCVGSLEGEPGRSLKINLTTGVWRDFAAGVGGSDPISLAAALAGISQVEAARRLAQMLGVADHE